VVVAHHAIAGGNQEAAGEGLAAARRAEQPIDQHPVARHLVAVSLVAPVHEMESKAASPVERRRGRDHTIGRNADEPLRLPRRGDECAAELRVPPDDAVQGLRLQGRAASVPPGGDVRRVTEPDVPVAGKVEEQHRELIGAVGATKPT
jgi:hypothetical protein